MNKLTRAVAWFHIIVYAILLFVVSAMLGGGAAAMAPIDALIAKCSPKPIHLIPAIADLLGTGLGMGVMLGIALAAFLLWVFLLRKHVWAWWALIVLLALGIAQMIVTRMPAGIEALNTVIRESPRASFGYLHFAAALALILDPPWGWRSKRSGARRRKKKSRSASSTSSSTTRSRRRRRRTRRS